jgi:hypothetical protein
LLFPCLSTSLVVARATTFICLQQSLHQYTKYSLHVLHKTAIASSSQSQGILCLLTPFPPCLSR